MSPKLLIAALMFVPLAATAWAAGAGSAPRIAETNIIAAQHPYDESADAGSTIAAAQAKAKVTGKKLMIVFGANWCPDCRALAGVLAFRDVRDWADKHFVEVEVDVGRFDRNLDLAGRFGVEVKHGIPAVAVVSPEGNVVNGADASVLADARGMTPQSVADVLARWAQLPSS